MNRLLPLLVVLVAAVLTVGCEREPPAAEPPPADALAGEIERLEALGYAGGSEKPGPLEGVTIHEPERASQGYNFYVSGHGPQAILMDMGGRVVHRWQYDIAELERRRGPSESGEGELELLERRHWRRAHLYPNGDILAIHTQFALIKLDRESRLLWEYPARVHHDLDVTEEGTIYVLTQERDVLPRINPEGEVFEDFIAVLDATGREIRKVSLLECVENAGLSELLKIMPREGDLMHTNKLEILDGSLADRMPAFARGNVLVSFLMLNTVAVVDMEAEKVVWTLQGDFRFQHDPTLLENGHLLLFDNLGPAMRGVRIPRKPGWLKRRWYATIFRKTDPPSMASAVLEIDPRTGQVVWSYQGSADQPFRSKTCGAAQRLPNGNTLIVESQFGRAFEVTPERRVVWEFVSPHRSESFVARLFDLRRVPLDFPTAWVREPGGEAS